MKLAGWNPLRIACVVGAVVAGGIGFVFPPAAPIAATAAKFLAGLAAGIAVRTPGHVPIDTEK
jgi:hypothetical protein